MSPQSTVAGRVVDVISEDDLESVEAEALPHLDEREGEESDRLFDRWFGRLRVAGIFGSAGDIDYPGFGHDALGILSALTGSFRIRSHRVLIAGE